MQNFQYFDLAQKICNFKGKNWTADMRRLEFLSLIDQNICKKNDQNSVFVSEAVHDEIIIWNNQIFEEGYLSHPKYLGQTVWLNIQLVPHSVSKYYWILLWLWLFMTEVVKYTMKVKVIKYFLQIFVIWNIWSWKKWGARYTFWYIVLLTLYNGDRRIVQWLQLRLGHADDDYDVDAPGQFVLAIMMMLLVKMRMMLMLLVNLCSPLWWCWCWP